MRRQCGRRPATYPHHGVLSTVFVDRRRLDGHIRVIWNLLHLASRRKHPAAESGRIRANLSATFARAHLAERRIPRAHERPSRLRSSLPSVTANIDQNPPARHNHRRATPEEKHTKNALCGFSAGLTMKCEPSHRMVWYSTNHENRHFPTIPEAPQYPPRPHQPHNRIKSRGVVQPAANYRPPPQHGPKSPQSAIRRKISFRRPKPGDCEFGARKGRAERSRCPINTPAIHPGKTHFRPLNPMIAHRKSRGTAGANGPNPNPSQAHPRH